MCSCSVVQESMWWNGNQIRDTLALWSKDFVQHDNIFIGVFVDIFIGEPLKLIPSS